MFREVLTLAGLAVAAGTLCQPASGAAVKRTSWLQIYSLGYSMRPLPTIYITEKPLKRHGESDYVFLVRKEGLATLFSSLSGIACDRISGPQDGVGSIAIVKHISGQKTEVCSLESAKACEAQRLVALSLSEQYGADRLYQVQNLAVLTNCSLIL